jgi:hypothetical protein
VAFLEGRKKGMKKRRKMTTDEGRKDGRERKREKEDKGR